MFFTIYFELVMLAEMLPLHGTTLHDAKAITWFGNICSADFMASS